ncbi:MAG: hypothetical protein NTX26_00375 [Candidatus Parcubacteria bacterium]|nr:hypothetical protein [Candidatus Parcubacteria bacterium]
MKKAKIVLIALVIVTFVLGYLSWAFSKQESGKEDVINLPNRGFIDISYYDDNLSDSNGNRAFPWGIETWFDKSGEGYKLPDSYFDIGQVRLIGHGTCYIAVLAIPDPPDKPKVKAGLSYTQSFEVKLDNVQGHGVRVIHQWFNSSDPFVHEIIGAERGPFETGSSDWHTISLTRTAPSGAITGDIIIELWGTGTVYIRNPEYHLTTIWDSMSQVPTHDIVLWLIVGFIVMVLVADFMSLVSFIFDSFKERHLKEGVK